MLDDLLAIKSALKEEWAYSLAEFERLKSKTLSERESLGFSWSGMICTTLSQSYRGQRVLLSHVKKKPLHDGIRPGDLVEIGPIHSSSLSIDGVCVDQEDDWAEIEVKEALRGDWLQKGVVAISRRFDDETYRRYERGLNEAIRCDSALSRALLSPHLEAEPFGHVITFPNLNRQQQIAASAAVQCRDFQLILGPPGTGKTHTLLAILSAWVDEGLQPWALAASNAATDHILSTAVKQGFVPLRLGSRYRIRAELFPYTMPGRLEKHPQFGALKLLNKELLRSKGSERGRLFREKRHLMQEMKGQIMSAADIICSTLGTMSRKRHEFPVGAFAIVDESTQAISPAIWSIVPHLKKLVMVGDPFQLGPTVTQPGNPLATSLFETTLTRAPHHCVPLHVQYRMNRMIMGTVSPVYGTQYVADKIAADRSLSELDHVASNGLTQSKALWIDTSGIGEGESRDPSTHSLFNLEEIRLCEKVALDLLQSGLKPSDLGIATPYSAQKQRLRSRLPGVEIDTINAFQGREKEVMICSFVRSNQTGELGFVADPRRLTVSLTRARRLWIGIGDAGVLCHKKPFSELMDYLERHESYYSAWEWPIWNL